MRTILFVVCALFLFGCSGADVESVESTQSPLVTYRTAVNGWTNLPAASQYYCHTTSMRATGGHAGAVVFNGGLGQMVPAAGAAFGGDTSAIAAIPYNTALGTSTQDVQCDSWSNFHGSGGAIAGRYWLSWSGTGMLSAVSGSIGAYYQDSVCGLSGAWSMSHASEKTDIDVTSNQWLYTLNATGFRELSAQTTCAWLGRPLYGQEWITATTASSPFSSYSSASGVCLVMAITGNLDDGSVSIIGGSQMRLEITGQVTGAKAMCFPK